MITIAVKKIGLNGVSDNTTAVKKIELNGVNDNYSCKENRIKWSK